MILKKLLIVLAALALFAFYALIRGRAEVAFPLLMLSVLDDATATACLALAPRAHADRRAFGHVYEYQTMPEGGLA